MGKQIHKLSEIDRELRRAICANCGPVAIKLRHSPDNWRCKQAVDERTLGRHGLTREKARELREDACCAVCGTKESLKVDHCHKTMKVRGVLCHGCNVAIGHMRDSPERLRQAADYLER